MTDHLTDFNQYLADVQGGKVPASEQIRLAVARHLRDLKERPDGVEFNEAAADRACRWMEKMRHVAGSWATPNIVLVPFQKFILCSIFGWLRPDGSRRFRRASVFMPRKTAKTTLASGIGLYMMLADGEEGATVFSVAKHREQARISLQYAKDMVGKLDDLREHFGVSVLGGINQVGSIRGKSNNSKWEALSRENRGSHDGLSPHCVILDECHAIQDGGAQYRAMRLAQGARRQPLLLVITTAGHDLSSHCRTLQEYAEQVLRGEVQDEELFAAIHCADPGDPWKDEATWRKAHPAIGVSVTLQYIRTACHEAVNNPIEQAGFETKLLNRWVDGASAFFNRAAFDDNRIDFIPWDSPDLLGLECWAAVDLSTRNDLTAIGYLFKLPDGRYLMKTKYYAPAAAAARDSGSKYQGWAASGHMILQPGSMINVEEVAGEIVADSQVYNVQQVGVDPFQAQFLLNRLTEAEVPAVEFRHTVANFSPAMKLAQALIEEGRIVQDGNPVDRWCLANVEAKVDHKREVYPRKGADRAAKIDGAICLLMALSLSDAGLNYDQAGDTGEIYFPLGGEA